MNSSDYFILHLAKFLFLYQKKDLEHVAQCIYNQKNKLDYILTAKTVSSFTLPHFYFIQKKYFGHGA